MSSLPTEISSVPPPKVFWPLMAVGIILASEIAPIGILVILVESGQSLVNWSPLLIASFLAYMNIAFPVPGGNITCILRVESMSAGDILLTTFPLPNTMKYEGVYFVNCFLPIRLPTQETIHVWAVGTPGIPADLECWSATATLLARHDVWLFGIRLLTLDYRIFAL
ncbi:MAG: hypothetical protein JOZ18_07225 [Chloroflexi bacterium]|nr:hypothetical protein [Chloroflexota bacterium]